jgi:hypothetical protein
VVTGDAETRIPHEEFVAKPVRSWRDGVNRVLHPRQGRRKAFLVGESSGSFGARAVGRLQKSVERHLAEAVYVIREGDEERFG